MRLADVINKVVTIEKDVKLIEVAKILSKEGISSLVYIKKGKAVGIITERDIIKNIASIHKKKLSDVMSKKLITIDYDKDLEDAVEIMDRKKIKRLLVVDDAEELVGIVTATDIIANADLLNRSFSFFG